ncbi:FadR/GntR family transcriptional regulator [Actinopolymorpha rutila]|uniref:GntR family transcriptional repressor for pyruvate dehydrogenase complex n=1 Tax=Actinopolymorpha rutila TaxID=446787 RepID=A0A852ZGK8_9ACTN|nr:FCD domain-containing protein [Actinopolymorpha rutila]NYH92227.1 GntR family transcriptional repressor for pyruvate dehydrogenase complex [Actinopolymorpha rutila]
MTSRELDARDREPFRLLPIKQVQVYREVFAQLDRLVSGSKPGTRLLPERELAEQLQVSRVSIREALRALESMGKVEIRRNSGTYVVDPEGTLPVEYLLAGLEPGVATLRSLTEVRAAIETRVVQAVGRQDAPDLRPAREFLARATEELSGEDTDQGSLDLRFEAILGRAADSPMLVRVQKWIHQAWITAWGEYGAAPGDRRSLHAEHAAILDALERGDVAQAVSQMDAHVDRHINEHQHPDEGG